ncbi:hypothetical protein [Sulfobacillus harzensis]|uniref:hypothetical protein n=1 Tax=Sulfobacillus harzensis TaxID=2729629 RepID=UPI001FAC0D8A|nr:hypothetical protein [Sulfobacillus harzensis]
MMGLVPRNWDKAHPRFQSPYRSLAVVMVVAFILVLALEGQLGTSVFGWLGTIGVLALLLVYLFTQVAAMKLFGRIGRWRGWQFAIPGLAVILLAYTLWSNIYPVPAAPGNYFPYLVLLWVAIGVVIAIRSPQAASRLGETLMREEA